MTSNTQITALCDGARNCWKVAEALEPLCKKMVTILDWFHLAMKIQNISLPEKQKAVIPAEFFSTPSDLAIKKFSTRENCSFESVDSELITSSAGIADSHT